MSGMQFEQQPDPVHIAKRLPKVFEVWELKLCHVVMSACIVGGRLIKINLVGRLPHVSDV